MKFNTEEKIKTAYCLAEGVQVRKESWGLLFYSQNSHRLLFVKSGNWLIPEMLSGKWNPVSLIDEVSRRTGCSEEIARKMLTNLLNYLIKCGIIVDEL